MFLFYLHRFIFILWIVLLFLSPLLQAQSGRQLESIRSEIRKYEKEMQQKQLAEDRTLDFIHKLDRAIVITRQKLQSLNREIRRKEQKIREYQARINDLERDIESLQALIQKRLVYYYKHGRSRRIELLLKTRSFSQLQVWMHYQKLIAQNDRRNLESLQQKKAQLQKTLELLKLEIKEKEQKVSERLSERSNLSSSIQKRRKHLNQLQDSKTLVAQKLEEVREAEDRILHMIKEAEEERMLQSAKVSGQRSVSSPEAHGESMEKLRGKMIWPVTGKIISHYGRHRHPRFSTVTENLGIEIKTRLGVPILAVAAGYVKTITYQRGRGTIIILSHANGYYSVYTNLAEIYVNVNDRVSRAQEIGTVGQSVLYNEPVFHFQIWKNTKNLDPEVWLE